MAITPKKPKLVGQKKTPSRKKKRRVGRPKSPNPVLERMRKKHPEYYSAFIWYMKWVVPVTRREIDDTHLGPEYEPVIGYPRLSFTYPVVAHIRNPHAIRAISRNLYLGKGCRFTPQVKSLELMSSWYLKTVVNKKGVLVSRWKPDLRHINRFLMAANELLRDRDAHQRVMDEATREGFPITSQCFMNIIYSSGVGYYETRAKEIDPSVTDWMWPDMLNAVLFNSWNKSRLSVEKVGKSIFTSIPYKGLGGETIIHNLTQMGGLYSKHLLMKERKQYYMAGLRDVEMTEAQMEEIGYDNELRASSESIEEDIFRMTMNRRARTIKLVE